MFLLRRLTARSSRSIAVMIGFARSGGGGRGGRMGSPDDDHRRRALVLPFLSRSTSEFNPASHRGRRPGGASFVPRSES
jgi:hypothetical protein